MKIIISLKTYILKKITSVIKVDILVIDILID